MVVGKRILIVRNKAEISKKTLANMIGVNPLSISNWETGKNQPREESKRKIEEVLGLAEHTLDKQVVWEV
jgi:transcriptional regulator with XRE-family HTH domain